jgi:hypothetical protein
MNDSERDALLVRLETKVDTLMTGQGDHEIRVRSLELTKNRQLGALSILSAACAGAWALLVSLWSK